MGKPISKTKTTLIRKELLKGVLDLHEICRKYTVTYNTVARILSTIKAEYKYLAEETRPAHFGGKTEAYYESEDEALSTPFYNPKELKGEELKIYKQLNK